MSLQAAHVDEPVTRAALPMPGDPEALLQTSVGRAINAAYLRPEAQLLPELLQRARLGRPQRDAVQRRAGALVQAVRRAGSGGGALDAFLRQYHLGSPEGVVLMCLAEALLRIPDAHTADRLIADKIHSADWEAHLGDSSSLLVNASTWSLMLTGRIVEIDRSTLEPIRGWFAHLVSRIGEPLARGALRQAMHILGGQFVMGRTIEDALRRAGGKAERAYRYSFDMLGEAALTGADADHYLERYRAAIEALGRHRAAAGGRDDDPGAHGRPGISVKLSALHPRFESSQRARVLDELGPGLLGLVRMAREAGIELTVDAEEAERLELSLLLIDQVLQDGVLAGYDGFGLAVQAYQRRAGAVIDWLGRRCRALRRRICVRLVKGAYWDTEIKRAQERGLASYPVFTRKASTDVSYLACVRELAGLKDVLYPQFATHNAHTVAYVAEIFGSDVDAFEYQRLHGMGEALYAEVLRSGPYACRVYAPVGPHEDLLPYLVRRLLENGANTSFVNRLTDASLPIEQVIADPVERVEGLEQIAHPRIVDPPALYGAERQNSRGVNLADGSELLALRAACARALEAPWDASALIDGEPLGAEPQTLVSPADESLVVGTVRCAGAGEVARAVSAALAAQSHWQATAPAERARRLLRAAEAFESHQAELVARCVREAGRTLADAIAEVREAVDFLRYYALQAQRDFGQDLPLPGPTGEHNRLRLRGRGVFACISPWNFPISIFTGQIAAALAAGNAAIAKPAEQTPLSAALAVRLLHAAGIPAPVLQFLPGAGADVGAALTADARIAGVVFTGSTETARRIERTLAQRAGTIAVLIAETGGINAMIVDSSALPEQVVPDALFSAFDSAGQRCSALRILLLQQEIAPRVLQLLAGCMDQLQLGDPSLLSTDIGPVIDRESLQMLESYAARVTAGAPWHHQLAAPRELSRGRFFRPLAVEVSGVQSVQHEIFGPILHVVRYRASELDAVVDAINDLGFGLTLGIHTRIDSIAERIALRAAVGNVYVNRNMIGAVVGVQPFGGMGLSGTGPKAGGPNYLQRFASEQTVTINTAAVGGNASLLSLAAD